MTLPSLHSSELRRCLRTEKYSPVSTANRIPITTQKVIWCQGRKNDETVCKVSRSEQRDEKKWHLLRQKIGISSEVINVKSFWHLLRNRFYWMWGSLEESHSFLLPVLDSSASWAIVFSCLMEVLVAGFCVRSSTLNIHWKDWCWSWSSNTLATWCEELTH